jgi:hypothetical protein
MTMLIMLFKGLLLVVLAFAAFATLAMALGFEPEATQQAAQCGRAPAPICLFTII